MLPRHESHCRLLERPKLLCVSRCSGPWWVFFVFGWFHHAFHWGLGFSWVLENCGVSSLTWGVNRALYFCWLIRDLLRRKIIYCFLHASKGFKCFYKRRMRKRFDLVETHHFEPFEIRLRSRHLTEYIKRWSHGKVQTRLCGLDFHVVYPCPPIDFKFWALILQRRDMFACNILQSSKSPIQMN